MGVGCRTGDTLLVKMTWGSILKDMPPPLQALCWVQPLDLPLPNVTDPGVCLYPGLGRSRTDMGVWGDVDDWLRKSLQGRHLSNVT